MALGIFIAILVVLILVHELGHFSVAKAFGIRVDEFGIFFPPRLWGKKIGETLYTINLLPFGGFVKIFGENSEAEDPARAADPASFISKPRYMQAAVVVAGIVFNLLFAWLALSFGYAVGMQTSVDHVGFGQVTGAQTTIINVLANSPAQKAGLRANDEVVSLQTGTARLGDALSSNAVQTFIAAHQSESVVFEVRRGAALQTFLAKPAEGFAAGHKAVGIELDDVGVLKLSPPLALLQAGVVMEHMISGTAVGLGGFIASLFTGGTDWNTVSGPIGIARTGSMAVKDGFSATIFLLALISVNLALLNLVPIPGLDGGRLLLIGIEAVRRKPLSERLVMRLTIAGFVLLAMLMLTVSFHDVVQLLPHQ